MTNTPFSKQCEIISALYLEYGEDPDYSEYFLMNDLGLFVSVLQCFDAVEVKPKAVKWVNNAFFCPM